jgi:hypothetical protein
VPQSKSRASKQKPAKGTAKGAGAAQGASTKGSGRTTPKGTASTRYTPPTPKTVVRSPLWVPTLMFALLGIGVAVVVVNYLGLLPGEQQNWYLILGLAEITAGFVVATVYK